MRLTQKSDYVLEHYEPNSTLYCILTKLGQLEDIEDAIGMSLIDYFKGICFDVEKNNQYLKFEKELGIDLATLLKALKNGIYWIKVLNNFHKKIVFSKVVRFCQGYLDCYDNEDRCYTQHINTQGYGRTWALTKEELE